MRLRPALAVGIGLVLLACERTPSAAQVAQERRARAADRAAPVAAQRRSAIVEAARRVSPAVVSVTVVKRQRERPTDPFDFFMLPRGVEREVQGLGTGFFMTGDGVVITNQHVTDGAEQIVVGLPDGNT